ncbi:hypothetical protein B0H10DRAFT_2435953 [Mycena sp. CBHHK59/15]|nr:hypothetical protein B0H10DRAFT_2435953 [Mycena sp. CBHHK59/15]
MCSPALRTGNKRATPLSRVLIILVFKKITITRDTQQCGGGFMVLPALAGLDEALPHMSGAKNSCRYTFIGAPTYTFESLRAILLVRPEIQPGFRLHYKGQEVDPTDTPEKLRALNKMDLIMVAAQYTYGVETALGPEDTDVLRTEPLTPPDARRWTWREWTPPPGSVQHLTALHAKLALTLIYASHHIPPSPPRSFHIRHASPMYFRALETLPSTLKDFSPISDSIPHDNPVKFHPHEFLYRPAVQTPNPIEMHLKLSGRHTKTTVRCQGKLNPRFTPHHTPSTHPRPRLRLALTARDLCRRLRSVIPSP